MPDNDGLPPPLKPGERPLFMNPEYMASPAAQKYPGWAPDEKPVLTEYDEHEELPQGSVLENPRHARLAVLHVQGKTNNQICEILGYSQSRVSILLHQPALVEEIHRLRAAVHADAIGELKALDSEAVNKMKEHLRDPREKLSEQVQTAKWILEKNHGKAKQEHTHESGTLAAFTDLLKKMASTGEQLQPVLEAEFREVPAEGEARAMVTVPEPGRFANWLDSELE